MPTAIFFGIVDLEPTSPNQWGALASAYMRGERTVANDEISLDVTDLANAWLDICEQSSVTLEDQLLAASVLWLQRAQELRSRSLSEPGGFPREQARQLALMDRLLEAVRNAVPELELERLQHEGDVLGALEHLRRTIEDRSGGNGGEGG